LSLVERGSTEVLLREPVKNPYIGFGGKPVEGVSFIGRENILAEIETLWTSPGALPPLFIYGHRRMGKTSILKNLNTRYDPKTILLYLNMENIGSIDDTTQFYLVLVQKIYNECSKAKYNWLTLKDAPDEAKFVSIGTATQGMNLLFRKLDEQCQENKLILEIDEFQIIENRIKEGRLLPETLGYLRSLAQEYNWFALIFAGLMQIKEMGDDYQNAFYGSSQTIKVSYLDRAETEKLIIQPNNKEFLLEYEPALVDELYRLTYGQPFLLQRLCWDLVNNWNDKFTQEDSEIERVLRITNLEAISTDNFYRAASYYFRGVWNQAGSEEQELLKVLAASESSGLTLNELQQSLAHMSEATLEEAIKKLQEHDVIGYKPETEQYYFFAELNRLWIRHTYPLLTDIPPTQ
jgi:hypothetical protein